MSEVVNLTVQADAGINLANRSGGLGIIAPLDAGANVAADVVRSYTNPDTVKTDHGDGSLLHVAAKAADSNLNVFFAGAFDDVALPLVAERTFGNDSSLQTGTLPASLLPLYDAGAVTIDGTAYDNIIYTSRTPSAATFPDLGDGTGDDPLELAINPETGVFYSGLATTGLGAGIVFTSPRSPDWAKLREVMLTKPVRYVVLAGWEFEPQYMGVYKDHVAWCIANDISVVAAAPDGAQAIDTGGFGDHDNGDTMAQLLAAVPGRAISVIFTHRGAGDTSDYGVAHAARWASLGDGGSPFYQPVAEGITIDREQVYTQSEYGSFSNPSAGTIHQLGGTVVIPSPSGSGFIYSTPRTTIPYSTDNFNYNSLVTYNRVAGVKGKLRQAGVTWVSASPINGRFNNVRLNGLRGLLFNKLQEAAQEALVDAPQASDVRVPRVEDTDVADRAVNTLDGVVAKVRIDNEVYTINITLGVGF